MYQSYFKRLLDLVASLFLLPFFLVLVLIIGPLIYWEDQGPIFYRQPRRGKDGSVFHIFKFRSMKVNAPDLRTTDGSTWNSKDDPRVTRIGRILRQSSLDEIPQLLNILLGDMSFIGPRPTRATQDYHQYSQIKKTRLKVRPGLTGYSQAYYRNSIGSDEKFRHDAYYAEHVSFFLDVQIIIQTVLSVISGKDINQNESPIPGDPGSSAETMEQGHRSHRDPSGSDSPAK